LTDVPEVGGKNASLGELYTGLAAFSTPPLQRDFVSANGSFAGKGALCAGPNTGTVEAVLAGGQETAQT
jgi:hypothetical protein